MSKPIIEVRDLSKRYRLGGIGAHSLRDEVHNAWTRFRKRLSANGNGKLDCHQASSIRHQGSEDFWALKDVSFDVQPGEVLGIIGRNGAGKSTLLKILSRITEPTFGEAILNGRVASLLEVGTGFHPELSGRENIFLNGAILGMKRWEIQKKLDEIVAFAEVNQFIDTPVKRYSSGMYVRLAFSVAAHLDPEILIVDEILAVGDANFQKKCMRRMGQASREGRTVLFVSHNITAVRSLCDRVVFLRGGRMIEAGDTEHVLHYYQSQAFVETFQREWAAPLGADSIEKVGMYLKEARIVMAETTAKTIYVNTPFSLAFCVRSRREVHVCLSPHYIGVGGDVIFAAPSPEQMLKEGDNWFICRMPGNLLNDGVYSVQLMIVENSAPIQVVHEALIFEVHEKRRHGAWHGKWPGVVRPNLEWEFAGDAPVNAMAP